jgi:HD-like signal output (HDOD) protein
MSPMDALQLLRAINDERCGAADLVGVLRSQPAIVAEIINHANTSYHFATKVKSLEQAIPLLGLQKVKSLAMRVIRRG